MKIVAAGIICNQGKILIAQRIRNKSLAYKWEFPGGKQEENESLEDCLKRELQEEMHLDIDVKEHYMDSKYDYDFGTICLKSFLAQSKTQNITFLDSHEAYKWIDVSELDNFEFAPADHPIVNALKAKGYPFK